MKKVVLPEGCKYIGAGAFSGNNQLDTVLLPSTLTAIHMEAFKGCSKIKHIVIPEHVTAINSSTFNGCTALTRVEMPDGVSTIGDNAFASCPNLDSIVLPKELTMIGGSAFSGIKLQDSLVIPDKVVSIGTNAFAGWLSLKELSIGKSVVLIGDDAFRGDSAITHITVWAATPPAVSEGTLADIPDSAWLSVLPDSRKLYREHPYWGRFRMNEEPDSAMIQRTVIVDAAETTANFTWPTDSAAHSYEIDIYKDGAVFCKLTLGPTGQLLGIAFSAPRKAPADKTETTLPYTLSFMVTGLEVASRYNYVLSALDAQGTPLHVYIGAFATTGYPETVTKEGLEVIPTPPVIPHNPEGKGDTEGIGIEDIHTGKGRIKMENGQLRIVCGERIYTLTGQEVK